MATANPQRSQPGVDPGKRRATQIAEFEQSWRDGRLEEMARRLPGDADRVALLTELVKVDLTRLWDQGKRPIVEDYLARYPELGEAATVAADLLLAEYLVRRRHGTPATLADFAARFPARAEELRQLVVHDTAAVSGSSPPSTLDSGPPTRAPQAGAEPVAERIGRYQIIKTLGRGGMGAVHLAHDPQLDRKVALKVPHFFPTDSGEILERFFREAKSAAAIEHPNICPVFEVGEWQGTHYVAMAYIEGHPLSDQIEDGKPLPQRPVAAVVRKLAIALEEAHRRGVVHRDLKPSNIMINQRREPVIMDFGLARRIDQGDERLTRQGAILGTPAYMAPEQVSGDLAAMGPSCDIYSLGVILYQMLTGRLPFQGSITAILSKILTEEAVRPSKLRPDLDATLEAICLKAMAKKPGARHASMAELAAELTQYLKSDRQATGSSMNVPFETAAPRAPAPASPKGVSTAQAQAAATQAPARDSTVIRPPALEPSAQAVLPSAQPIAPQQVGHSAWPWILVTLILATGLAGGVFYFISQRQTSPGPTITAVQLNLSQISNTAVTYILDNRPVTREELEKPLQLPPGKYALLVKHKDGSEEPFWVTVEQGRQDARIEPAPREEKKSADPSEPLGHIVWVTDAFEKDFNVLKREYDPAKREVSWVLEAKRETFIGVAPGQMVARGYWAYFFDTDQAQLIKLPLLTTVAGKISKDKKLRATLKESGNVNVFKRTVKVVIADEGGPAPAPKQIAWDISAWEKFFVVDAPSQDSTALTFSWLLTAKQDLYLGTPPVGGGAVNSPAMTASWGRFYDADKVELRKTLVQFSKQGPVKKDAAVRATLSYSTIVLKQTVKIVVGDKDGATPPQPEIVWDTSAWERQFTVGSRSHDPGKSEMSWILTAKEDAHVGGQEADYWGRFYDGDEVKLGQLQVTFEPTGKVKPKDKVRAILPYRSFDKNYLDRAKKVVVTGTDGTLPGPPQITWDLTELKKEFNVDDKKISHDAGDKKFTLQMTPKQSNFPRGLQDYYWASFRDADNVEIGKVTVELTPKQPGKQGAAVRATVQDYSVGNSFLPRARKVVILPLVRPK